MFILSFLVPNLGNGHLVVDRLQWGASELANKLSVPLKHPIPYVLITHIGVQSTPCYNIYKCSIKMRTIQDSAIAEKGLPDIQANFYVSCALQIACLPLYNFNANLIIVYLNLKSNYLFCRLVRMDMCMLDVVGIGQTHMPIIR